MIKVEASMVINKPVAEVFSVVADPCRDPQWHFDVVEAGPADGSKQEGAVREGGKYRWVFDYMGMGRIDAEAEVKLLEPSNRLDVVAIMGPSTQLISYRLFAEEDGACRITRLLEMEGGIPPEMEAEMTPRVKDRGHLYLLALKKLIEEEVTAPAWSNASCACSLP